MRAKHLPLGEPIHRSKIVKAEMKKSKIDCIYGVSYNPQLNIIENFFRSFKCKIKNTMIKNRIDINKMIRKCLHPRHRGCRCWNDVSIDVLVNTYTNMYD